MGWHNPVVPWRQLERTLNGDPAPTDGGDSPAWSRKREGYLRPTDFPARRADDLSGGGHRVPYAELHCHSNFSFLDGASDPEELVEEAARLELDAIALTDHDGMYGVVRFADAARELGVKTVFGTELSFGLSGPQNGIADPEGEHLLLLAEREDGYAALCRAITAGQLRGHDAELPKAQRAEKGRPVYDLESVAAEVYGKVVVLTGCRKGPVRRALLREGQAGAAREMRRLMDLFGPEHVFVELIDQGHPGDSTHNDALAALADELGLLTVATGNVHYATPDRARLAGAMAAIRARRSVDEMEGWLPASGMAFLHSGEEMAARFARYPGAVQRAALLGQRCAFDLKLMAPNLPPFDLPEGETEASFLRETVREGALKEYGPPEKRPDAWRQIEHELDIIEKLNFPGYFLIVWDIARFCHEQGILCQGRGSAANSAVCYALGITKVDSVKWKLLFERFLAPDRDGYPDIDLDIESDRREEVIQYVYAKHGRLRAAQVANVITYRAKSAVRDAARALGYSPGQQDAWSKQIDRWGPLQQTRDGHDHDIPVSVLELAGALEDFPRHLGIHSGGMVICDRPVSEVCPIEWARMENRSVLQWEKDDCASAGLVKFDLLGLGMLSALRYMLELVAEHKGVEIDLGKLDLGDRNVYEMLQRADAIGVFQVESRAQMATLPRLKPEKFYDLAIEVALIRPGPIQGGSVHPYIRRKNGQEKWEHDHPLLEPALGKTYGVPLFQEQMMQIALDVADFTAAEADELRHAMGAKRSTKKMERLRRRFYAGAAKKGIDEELAGRIFQKMKAFSNFGFPESHALSFAYLVFASAYFKYYHPDAFCAGLLRAQPMGFYSPQSLVADARRHGVVVHGPDVNASLPHATLEPAGEGRHAVRVGLATVRLIGQALAEELVRVRENGGPFTSMADVARRVRLTRPQVEALATAGAFGCFPEIGGDRRRALWAAGAVAEERPEKLPGTGVGTDAPTLPGMDEVDLAVADVWATGMSPDSYPTQFIRDRLDALGVVPAAKLADVENGKRVLIGGAVTHRQRPATAGGITFLNIEDETGMVNVVCTAGLWGRYHRIARGSSAMLVRGVVERADGVVSILADRLQNLPMRISSKSRDFR
ncbi:error-prone DNA polymerase [Amycolatopsis bartoniae]|uniref:Error-prone DNA polymerase n=1 Tax=Amycolatopsis bartoniae TaxID=941986 RepID=A0A8H9J567_9PSEU|nr:error-prone DNA polymerase [Amycolatopsis bartoniae]MBB2937485.1 error-prone DNA polymerase [Amycolatopsis bartoniae]TVS99759.1 error-prone DNA polymerase [Amycolatopsis bartoniae]GHF87106.1 error-prone DNA polymerase [Amycolatopsis bartoniae]